LKHAIEVAWTLKEETANLVVKALSSAPEYSGLPDDLMLRIERLARRGHAPQLAFIPTRHHDVNRLNRKSAIEYIKNEVGEDEVLLSEWYEELVTNMKNYLRRTYGMRIAGTIPGIQLQKIMSDILLKLKDRPISEKELPKLVVPSRDYAPRNPNVFKTIKKPSIRSLNRPAQLVPPWWPQ
jgi:hypothetical protein